MAGRRRDWPPEQEAELRRLLAEGVAHKAIAKRMQIGLTSVEARIRKLGLVRRPRPRPAKAPGRPCRACGRAIAIERGIIWCGSCRSAATASDHRYAG